jgi:hypothetical protein
MLVRFLYFVSVNFAIKQKCYTHFHDWKLSHLFGNDVHILLTIIICEG